MMKDWRRFLVFTMMLVLFGCGTAFAAESVPEKMRVYDQADLFSYDEEMELASKISELQETMDMGLAVVTTEDNSGSARDYADDFYEQYEIGTGKNHDGALFLIDMENGELWISTEGKMIRYLTDDRINEILDASIEYAYEGEFYESAYVFLNGVEKFYEKGIQADQYNYDTETGKVDKYKSIQWYEFLIAFVIASAAGGIAVVTVLRDYGMKNEGSRMASNFRLSYRKDSAFTLGNVLADVLLNTYVTRTVIRTQNNQGSGGGVPRGGRSSTHRSGSGRVHGGGGRKFK